MVARTDMAEHVIELEVPYFDPEPNVPEPVVVKSERKCFLSYGIVKVNENRWSSFGAALLSLAIRILKLLEGIDCMARDLAFMEFLRLSTRNGLQNSLEGIRSLFQTSKRLASPATLLSHFTTAPLNVFRGTWICREVSTS